MILASFHYDLLEKRQNFLYSWKISRYLLYPPTVKYYHVYICIFQLVSYHINHLRFYVHNSNIFSILFITASQVTWFLSWTISTCIDTTLCDEVCQWLVTGQWASPVSSTSKTIRHDITEIIESGVKHPAPAYVSSF